MHTRKMSENRELVALGRIHPFKFTGDLAKRFGIFILIYVVSCLLNLA